MPRRKKRRLHQRQAHLAVTRICPLDFPSSTSRTSLPPRFLDPFLQHGPSLAGEILPAKHEAPAKIKAKL